MGEILVIGATFRDAEIRNRELLTFVEGSLSDRLRTLAAIPELDEVLLLSTCNRIEIYGAISEGFGVEEAAVAVRKTWADLLGSKYDFVLENTTNMSGADAVSHCFRVMASLESLVVGEAQILGQVKESYRIALEVGTVGSVLRELFEQGFRSAKRVRTETEIGRDSVSVGSVAVDLSLQIFDPIAETRVLLVGAGKIARLAAHRLQNEGVKSLTVVNRTQSRAEALAARYGWKSRRFQDLDLLLPEMDIVITSTGSSRPIIDVEMVKSAMGRRRYRPVFFIDLALPRDVSSDVGDLDRVYLYNIDDLESIANRNLHHRAADVAAAEELVGEGIERFYSRQRRAGLKPFLTEFAQHTEEVRDEEVERALQRLLLSDERSRKIVFQMGHNIVQRLTRGAFKLVKSENEPAEAERVSELLARSYGLVDAPVSTRQSFDDSEEIAELTSSGTHGAHERDLEQGEIP